MDIKEPIVVKFHPHPFCFLGFYFGGIIFMVLSFFVLPLLFLAGILIFILAEVFRRAETFYVLESGVAKEYKLLSTYRKFAEFSKIQNMEVNQSFLENILGIGTIHLDTAGTDEREVSFRGARDPYKIEQIIREKMKTI
ncbi:hypothetical protein A3C67_03325 [Candidatus Nomurabacteria bacterium RIFCSPHIGHO2_02_FULL_42_19]|uniref:YdbS-like PH domain-containing protein n=1 Tax=Candidatus Nomurabacteria bacterium RIFCSPHIGHO2_02_FULL_42_19 TaxID=1801756 RepID=A0A1F6W2T1_9BACT|nr:MAG: hypothetical protein A3C67_03325 [Candidatus Nomurabacteria bacterium RIFCSPHIGHO2_02_FULL_42_19]